MEIFNEIRKKIPVNENNFIRYLKKSIVVIEIRKKMFWFQALFRHF